MDFNHFLSSYFPDPAYGGAKLYKDMVEQAVWADRLGYRGVSIPEHHLINILLVPSPLQMAVKIAAHTSRIELMTSIAVLPIRDMRVFAGEVIQASFLTDNRLILGVGRGAFAYELARLGVPIDVAKDKFGESLEVLEALLGREEVSWSGKYYQFEPITIMPRPQASIPLMVAVMSPETIEAAAAKGYTVQTTPLGSAHSVLMDQVNAYRRGREKAPAGSASRLALQRGIYLARNAADARRKIALAYNYYERFDNLWSGPGIVERGQVKPLPRRQSLEELSQSLVVCERSEMIDRLASYAEAGIDEIIVTSNYGQPQQETLDMMQRFAEEIMPHFNAVKQKSVA